MRKIFLLFFVVLISQFAFSQHTVKGKVVDKDSKEPLIGVSIIHVPTSTGTSTDLDGYFEVRIPDGKQELTFSYIGYTSLIVNISGEYDLGTIEMESEAIGLQDVTITSSIAVPRKTPVALSVIEPREIEAKLGGNLEFPEILKSTPGIYVTRDGGGFGDAKTNVRGFKSENVALMINGVPMNDMEWGGTYWSNWSGIRDVTRYMQVQRGLGASKVSAPSVGGSINIVTRTTDAKKGGNVSYSTGNDGQSKIIINLSTGLLDSGWAFSFLGSRESGDGYIQGTDYEGYTYFVNISKIINNHTLSLTGFGSPQWHYKRNSADGLTIKNWQTVQNYMGDKSLYRYNATYGFGRNGERKTSQYNLYHKPQISLNHQWQINSKSSLSTALYSSIGRGYGYAGQGYNSTFRNYWYGASNGNLNYITVKGTEIDPNADPNLGFDLRNSDGTYAYDKVYDINEFSQNGGMMVMSKSKNYHNWYGLLSTYTTQLTSNIDFYAGIDLRYYKGVHTNELIDLYGADYFIDSSSRGGVSTKNHALAGSSDFINKKLKVGDVVYRDYDGYTMQEGVFAQAEGNYDKLNVFIAGSLSNTAYWRYDRFYYDDAHAKSETLNFWGYTAKGGANFNFTETQNVFANIGYISRAPFFSGGAFLQSTTSNMINPDAVNEKIFSVELGYGFRSKHIALNVNLYHTMWMDKTMTRGAEISGADDRYAVNMQGVDAKHQGIEFDFKASPLNWLDITGMVSIGNWIWNSNSIGYFYNSQGQALADLKGNIASGILADDHAYIKVNLKDVPVAGSAQTTFALGASAKITKDIRLGVDYTYASRNFADWSFSSNDLVPFSEKTYTKTWKIPGAGTLDGFVSYNFDFAGLRTTLSANVNNILNQEYIADAYDGDGTADGAYRIMYGFGRTWSMRWKINF